MILLNLFLDSKLCIMYLLFDTYQDLISIQSSSHEIKII